MTDQFDVLKAQELTAVYVPYLGEELLKKLLNAIREEAKKGGGHFRDYESEITKDYSFLVREYAYDKLKERGFNVSDRTFGEPVYISWYKELPQTTDNEKKKSWVSWCA